MSLFGWCAGQGRLAHDKCIAQFTRASDGVTVIVCECPCHIPTSSM